MQELNLHIGGKQPKDGWRILNIQPDEGVDFVGDITNLDVFDDESCHQIYASHVLEHVPHAQVGSTLAGLRRILIPSGRLYISVPDLDILCRMMISPTLDTAQRNEVMRMIYGGQRDHTDFHQSGFTHALLSSHLVAAGFSKSSRVTDFQLFADASLYRLLGTPVSLNIIALK